MIDQVKSLLNKHSYIIKLVYDKRKEHTILRLPKRVQAPEVDAHDIVYEIGDNVVICTIDGQKIEIECPKYACRTLIFADIKQNCEHFGFHSSLIEFHYGDDIIQETEFFNKIWPSTLEYTEDIRKQEYPLFELVSRAINAKIPFHASFDFEAAKLGVSVGYILVRSFVIGEKKHE